ncbi:SET and MYND domain-containing protein 5 [Elysia marginata]|uniref:SET and MYND domain-containing protein 5 n=1 Tax=Elysia marginata TaxID=1093978 RepID=A0AAV4J0L1_9GAST|nr:SET and MYND domain-containing protein 5 [Elysia marginata]
MVVGIVPVVVVIVVVVVVVAVTIVLVIVIVIVVFVEVVAVTVKWLCANAYSPFHMTPILYRTVPDRIVPDRTVPDRTIPDRTVPDRTGLQTVFGSELFANCGGGVRYPITAEEFNGRYYQAACNLQCFSPSITPYHRFLNNIKEDMRSVGLIRHLTDRPPEAQFAAMCPLHACTNHSCYNNAEVCDAEVYGRPGVQMIARRDIKKGDEIFITYIDTTVPKLLRKAWLYKSFNFWCNCLRCQFEGDQPTECSQCLKKTPDDSKQFPACSKCKKAWYCGTKCQKEAWKRGHKVICNAPHSQVTSPTETVDFSHLFG